ncbi:hypothetical protein RDI58_007894 [Solanum bulbocastanum]|uniref:Uncharacterized protein n=1 Tax=Solanum bulbocastanum TaxID=147425 RepID=A0AAN8YJN7_SOLBU
MEKGDSPVNRWDIFVKILRSFDLFQLIYAVPQVCSAWQLAFSDPLLCKTLDLLVLQSNFIRILTEPYVFVDTPSRKKLTRLLKICMNLSHRNIETLIFHYNLYVDDNQLTYTANRCPRLKRLVMPAWEKLEKPAIRRAFRKWKDLESLTMLSLEKPAYGLKQLKVLNISHCLITEDLPPPAPMKILTELDESILEKASRLDKFLTCMSDSCIMCQHTRNDEGFMRWYKYEDLWKVDEVKSLAI